MVLNVSYLFSFTPDLIVYMPNVLQVMGKISSAINGDYVAG